MDEETASDYAYMASEAAAWQNIKNLLALNDSKGYAGDVFDLANMVCRATAVDQTVKVSVLDIDV
jgi:hypothetical protein